MSRAHIFHRTRRSTTSALTGTRAFALPIVHTLWCDCSRTTSYVRPHWTESAYTPSYGTSHYSTHHYNTPYSSVSRPLCVLMSLYCSPIASLPSALMCPRSQSHYDTIGMRVARTASSAYYRPRPQSHWSSTYTVRYSHLHACFHFSAHPFIDISLQVPDYRTPRYSSSYHAPTNFAGTYSKYRIMGYY